MKRNARIALGLFITAALGTITWTNETVDLLAKFGVIANPIYTFFIMNAVFSFSLIWVLLEIFERKRK